MADDYVTRVISVELIRSLGHYEGKGALIIGVVQVLLGVWSLALGIAHCLTQTILFGDVGYGIWGGVVIVAHMVMSIIAAVLASLQFCLGVSAAYFDHKHILEGLPEGPYSGTVVVDCLLAVVGISEAILATAAAALGCKVTCCNNKFLAAQQELDNPQVRTYHVNESYKYVVNPERL